MKRLLSMFCAVILLVISITSSVIFVGAASAPISGKVLAFDGSDTQDFNDEVMAVEVSGYPLSPVFDRGCYQFSTNRELIAGRPSAQLGCASVATGYSGYNAIAVYVSIPETANTVSIQMQFAFGNTGIDLYSIPDLGKPYYKYSKSGLSADTIGGDEWFKSVSFTGGFDGYVIFPFSSFTTDFSAQPNVLNFYNVWAQEEGDVTVGGFKLSSVMLANLPGDPSDIADQVQLEGETDPVDLFYKPVAAEVMTWDSQDTTAFAATTMTPDADIALSPVFTNGAYTIGALTSDLLSGQLGGKAMLSKTGYNSLAFYVSIPETENTIALQMQFFFGDAGLEVSSLLNNGAPYYLYDKNGISPRTAVSTGYECLFEFAGGYEGYVIVPFSSMANADAATKSKVCNFYYLWARETGDAASVGSFNISGLMVLNTPKNPLGLGDTVLLNGQSTPTKLMPDKTAPVFSGDVTIKSRLFNAITVEWMTAVDNQSSNAHISYKVYKNTDLNALKTAVEGKTATVEASVTGKTYATVSGLTASTAYYFAIEAADQAGNTAVLYSDALSTKEAPPSEHPIANTEHFTMPSPAVGNISQVGYNVELKTYDAVLSGQTVVAINTADASLFGLTQYAYIGAAEYYDFTPYNAAALYVKIPETMNNVSLQLMFALNNDAELVDDTKYAYLNPGSNIYLYDVNTGEKVYTKAVGHPLAETIVVVGAPSGFEGYVIVPTDSMSVNVSQCTKIANLFLVRPMETGMAETCGAISIGELTALNLKDTEIEKYELIDSKVDDKVPGGAEAENNTDGDISGVLQAESVKVSINTPLITGSRKDDVTAQQVENLSGWLFDKMWRFGVKSGAESISNNADLSPVAGISLSTESVALFAEGGAMFYVKMPENASVDNVLQVTFAITSGGITTWDKAQEGKAYYTLAKGESDWEAANVGSNNYENGTNHGFKLTPGFEGYVFVPSESMGSPEGKISMVVIYLEEFGAQTGDFYFGSLLSAQQSRLTRDGVVLDGRKYIQNLFTGARMEHADTFPLPVTFTEGQILNTIPSATTDSLVIELPSGNDIGATYANLKWNACDGAAKYRVDLFTTTYTENGIAYVFIKSETVDTNSFRLDGLVADNRYAAQVRALTADGREIAVYEKRMFTTSNTYGSGGDNGEGEDDGDGGGDGENAPIVDTGVKDSVHIAIIAVCLSLCIAFFACANKKIMLKDR